MSDIARSVMLEKRGTPFAIAPFAVKGGKMVGKLLELATVMLCGIGCVTARRRRRRPGSAICPIRTE